MTVKAEADSIRREARTWDKSAEALKEVEQRVELLRMTRTEAGVFQILFTAYDKAVTQVSDRCREGGAEMGKIADALFKTATAYEENEGRVSEELTGIY
ncbi:hypothetical protein [Streptomyces winkii]|uniref:hypothetical protein n=1 Tax=Streptomyces winkii TaxID=3051178 RepID=UPI0028D79B6C|nr:hypothetical protein [Streptomyces sp. DSM 40971]